jgi:hypothetical protein
MVMTIGHYPEPSKTKILLPPTERAGTRFFRPVLASGFNRGVRKFLKGKKDIPKKQDAFF